MFILRAKRNKQGKVLRQGMTVLFFTVGEEFLDQEQLHPKNLKKIRGKAAAVPLQSPACVNFAQENECRRL